MARRSKAKRESEKTAGGPTTLRIIGGHFRGRKLAYHGELHTRPMKERVREALFNLVGPSIKGSHVIDLFAGTGALGLEAISRGAVSATFIERHFPTADIIEQNIAGLDVADRCHVVSANTFLWIRDAPKLPPDPWLVLCSPPFDFFVDQVDAMITLVQFFLDRAAPGSQLLVEADNRFDFEQLPQAADWDVRTYSPAVLGLLRVGQ